MATPDLPAEAVEAAAPALWDWLAVTNEEVPEWPDADGIDQRATREGAAMILAAAVPHIRADERARVLDEVQAALRELDLNDLEMRFIHERLGK